MESKTWLRVGAFGLVFGLAVVHAGGCDQYRTAALTRVFPVALPRPVEESILEGAIETSLAKRHWLITNRRPRLYEARLSERVHEVEVAIAYDARGFSIRYLHSENLLYEEHSNGTASIHRKYETWVQNLAYDIQQRVAQARSAPAPSALSPAPAPGFAAAAPRVDAPGVAVPAAAPGAP